MHNLSRHHSCRRQQRHHAGGLPGASSAMSTTSHMRQYAPNWSQGPPYEGPGQLVLEAVRPARHCPLTCEVTQQQQQQQQRVCRHGAICGAWPTCVGGCATSTALSSDLQRLHNSSSSGFVGMAPCAGPGQLVLEVLRPAKRWPLTCKGCTTAAAAAAALAGMSARHHMRPNCVGSCATSTVLAVDLQRLHDSSSSSGYVGMHHMRGRASSCWKLCDQHGTVHKPVYESSSSRISGSTASYVQRHHQQALVNPLSLSVYLCRLGQSSSSSSCVSISPSACPGHLCWRQYKVDNHGRCPCCCGASKDVPVVVGRAKMCLLLWGEQRCACCCGASKRACDLRSQHNSTAFYAEVVRHVFMARPKVDEEPKPWQDYKLDNFRISRLNLAINAFLCLLARSTLCTAVCSSPGRSSIALCYSDKTKRLQDPYAYY
jgi:hypothetical protein